MDNRIATNYAVTRKQKRYIAKQNMKKAGLTKFCKHSYTTNYFHGKPVGTNKIGSKFSSKWREYVEVTNNGS